MRRVEGTSVTHASSPSTSKLLRALGAGLHVATAIVRTHSLTYLRLYLLARRVPYHTTGLFRFPFGAIRYIDIGSLPFIYYEIFVDRVYETVGLGEAPRIFDCGGNIGISTIWFKQQYPKSAIIVFEADPEIAVVLEANVKTLGLGSVQVVHAAVSASSGSAAFLEDKAIGGRLVASPTSNTVTVRTVQLSDYVNEAVDLLKLDIEGAEFEVLQDLCGTGKINHVRNLICEIHGTGAIPDPVADLWKSLSQAGFRVSVNWAEAIEEKKATTGRPPFPALPTAHFRMLMYAWRP